jgi:hypothetical protein
MILFHRYWAFGVLLNCNQLYDTSILSSETVGGVVRVVRAVIDPGYRRPLSASTEMESRLALTVG